MSSLHELVGDLLRGVARDRESDADVARALASGRDRRVDADHPTRGVDQRATGVARVDRGVGLDRVLDRRLLAATPATEDAAAVPTATVPAAARIAQVAVQTADDARGHGAV